eukprot:CAMPEP_0170478356 /NCGR_PEP_ID=MMETSP0123-20130129/19397_1 /TAXON_ID=182087 /ORGANISM="Favella ehrenbergii, Strain Fehren 1" /LENGTH=52 /DNA_ID=CAMNT_0010750565 /DNA_START=148 /DNA_END=306 /DNA_ORIENTATION=-
MDLDIDDKQVTVDADSLQPKKHKSVVDEVSAGMSVEIDNLNIDKKSAEEAPD